MASTTYLKVVGVTLSGAEVEKTTKTPVPFRGGRLVNEESVATETSVVKWHDLFAAVSQSDENLAGVYRTVLEQALPLAKQARDEAYSAYCGHGVTTRDNSPGSPHVAGHGSWVNGPDGALQSRYQGWDEVLRQAAKVMA